MTLTFHPVADIFPMMSAAEFNGLKADIAEHGQREPIVIHDNMILDGRNRYMACAELGLKPITREWDGDGSPVAYVISLNLHRRHLNESQRAMVAAKVANMPPHRPSDKSAILQTSLVSQAEAAQMLSVSTRSVATAVKVQREATPETVAEVERGDKTITEAMREIKRDDIERKRQAVREIIDTIPIVESEPGPSHNTISHCRIEDLILPAASVDMIFTDPPYHDEYIELYAKLTNLADHVLKPGGYVMAYVGKMFLPDVMRLMSAKLEYVSIFAVFQPFSKSRIMKHNIFENWRPIIAFKKPGRTETKEWAQDVVRGNREKDYHDWQQDSEAPMQYITAYTKPGDVVLDPFCGGGTTPAACKELGRFFLAFDADPEAVKTTIWRLNGNTSISQS